MADNSVFITGAATGALAEALDGLPGWATEDTAKSIELILKQSLGIQTKALSEMVKKANGGNLSPAQVKQLNDELDDLVKNFHAENAEEPKKRRRRKEDEEEQNKKKRRWKEAREQSSLLGEMQSSILELTDKTRQAMIDNVNTFDQLYRSGVNVVSGFDSASNGFEALRQMTVLSGVRFTELSKTMEKFSTVVNTFGAAKFVKTMSAASAELGKFGYSTKETGELLGAYLESQRGFADVNSRTQAEVEKDLIKFGERITRVSMATGMLRSKLLENIDAVSKTVEATILSGQIGEAASSKTQEFIASFSDRNVGNAFLRMMTDAIKPLNATFMDFQKIGLGGFGQKLMEFTRSLEGLDAEEAQKRTAEFAEVNKAEFARMTQQANFYRSAGMKEAEGVLNIIAGVQQQARAYNAVTAEERKKAEIARQASADLKNAQERLLSQFQATFAPLPKMLDGLTEILEGINRFADMFRGAFDKIDEFLGGFDVIKDNFGEMKLLPWVGFGIAMFSFIKSVSWLSKLISSGFSVLTGRRAKGAASAASKAGKGAGILGAIGEGTGGILEGLAKGIGAFANPKILLGASILAGSIAIIGAGIAGATWILGASLPKFAEGIKAFDGINGGNLIEVAKGVAAMGGAILAFGASSAVAGISGIIGTLGGAFSKLFGDGSLIDQLKILSAIGPGLSQAVSAINEISGSLSNLSSTLGSFKGMDALKNIVSTINSIDILKAMAFGALGLGGKISLPPATKTEGVSNPTTPKPSTLNSPSKVSTTSNGGEQATAKEPSKPTATGIEKGPADTSINSMLSYQNSLMEQLVLSTNNLVSVNKDILKYTKVHS